MNHVETNSIAKYLYENVQKLVRSGRWRNRYIVVFGANKPAVVMLECLEKQGVIVDAVVDNNKQKREMIATGKMPLIIGKYELQSPQDVLGNYREDALILIASQCYHDMCSDLVKMGYDVQSQTVQLLSFPALPKERMQGIKYISQEEMKQLELQILKYFRDTCDRLGLRYSLCGGTLLGAVRHQGYIPWDDDIDVLMPVPDYMKLMEQFEEDEIYKLLNFENCQTSYMFTRLIDKRTVLEEVHYPLQSKTAINIDIFPISGFPSCGEDEVAAFTEEILSLRNAWDDYWFSYGMKENEDEYEELKCKVKDVMTRYDFDNSEMVGYIVTGKLNRELLPKENFNDYIYMEFEGEQYKVFKGYSVYLSNMYEDYMQMPPKEQQESHHDFNAWWEI